MTTGEKRQRLITFLAKAEDDKVNALYLLLERNIDEEAELTPEEERILEEREANYLSGKSKVSPWQDVHERVKNKKKRA